MVQKAYLLLCPCFLFLYFQKFFVLLFGGGPHLVGAPVHVHMLHMPKSGPVCTEMCGAFKSCAEICAELCRVFKAVPSLFTALCRVLKSCAEFCAELFRVFRVVPSFVPSCAQFSAELCRVS